MNDGFSCNDIWFTVALQYVFGEDALVKIEVEQNTFGRDTPTFFLSIPSLDALEYQKEFQAGTFAISDLRSYVRTYTWLTRKLRDMRKRGETSYCSPAWVAGRG